ncbi:hypothetical protein PIB30_087659 [Stylosanthes scabra]|uniref:Uncharacterized protein n=1 Tax=Stylosanthes scabra TaxID=79078 RepID=A0ABU6ZSB6_9FABA|nr:hypothetical protein [Stylosanthes scabra]
MTIKTNNFIEETRSNFRNQGEFIRNLETQVSQLAKQLATRSPNTFLSDTEGIEERKRELKEKWKKFKEEQKKEKLKKELIKTSQTLRRIFKDFSWIFDIAPGGQKVWRVAHQTNVLQAQTLSKWTKHHEGSKGGM